MAAYGPRNSKYRADLDRQSLVDMYRTGEKTEYICAVHRISRATLYRILNQRGIPLAGHKRLYSSKATS